MKKVWVCLYHYMGYWRVAQVLYSKEAAREWFEKMPRERMIEEAPLFIEPNGGDDFGYDEDDLIVKGNV